MSMGTGPAWFNSGIAQNQKEDVPVQRYYILLKASGGYSLPEWLPYRLDAVSAEEAIKKAKKLAETHYLEYTDFEVQLIENEGRSK